MKSELQHFINLLFKGVNEWPQWAKLQDCKLLPFLAVICQETQRWWNTIGRPGCHSEGLPNWPTCPPSLVGPRREGADGGRVYSWPKTQALQACTGTGSWKELQQNKDKSCDPGRAHVLGTCPWSREDVLPDVAAAEVSTGLVSQALLLGLKE